MASFPIHETKSVNYTEWHISWGGGEAFPTTFLPNLDWAPLFTILAPQNMSDVLNGDFHTI